MQKKSLTGVVLAFALGSSALSQEGGPPPRPDVPVTSTPATRFGEACEYVARGTLVSRYDFALTGVADRTTIGEPEVWIAYTATNRETGTVHEEVFGCAFAGIADPAEVILQAAVVGGRPLSETTVAVLNLNLGLGGFNKAPTP